MSKFRIIDLPEVTTLTDRDVIEVSRSLSSSNPNNRQSVHINTPNLVAEVQRLIDEADTDVKYFIPLKQTYQLTKEASTADNEHFISLITGQVDVLLQSIPTNATHAQIRATFVNDDLITEDKLLYVDKYVDETTQPVENAANMLMTVSAGADMFASNSIVVELNTGLGTTANLSLAIRNKTGVVNDTTTIPNGSVLIELVVEGYYTPKSA